MYLLTLDASSEFQRGVKIVIVISDIADDPVSEQRAEEEVT